MEFLVNIYGNPEPHAVREARIGQAWISTCVFTAQVVASENQAAFQTLSGVVCTGGEPNLIP